MSHEEPEIIKIEHNEPQGGTAVFSQNVSRNDNPDEEPQKPYILMQPQEVQLEPVSSQ